MRSVRLSVAFRSSCICGPGVAITLSCVVGGAKVAEASGDVEVVGIAVAVRGVFRTASALSCAGCSVEETEVDGRVGVVAGDDVKIGVSCNTGSVFVTDWVSGMVGRVAGGVEAAGDSACGGDTSVRGAVGREESDGAGVAMESSTGTGEDG